MSTLKTHNLQSSDSGSVNISLAPNAGMIVAGLSTYSNQINVGSNIKLGTAGVVTATSFVGSGANLTNLPAQATIANNADNRVITGGSGVNLNGEANLTYNGSILHNQISAGARNDFSTSADGLIIEKGGNTGLSIDPGSSGIANIYFPNESNHSIASISHNNSNGEFRIRGEDHIILSTNGNTERFRITSDGDIYGPSGGRKNWFDNGSFDCTYGGRKQSTSMDYGNHHAYGWVTDRFMSRNSVEWSRSTNVPTGKGFSYSTYTNGAGGTLMQAVELPDYGDMGVFTPGSYWCVSVWSTAGLNHGGSAFSYDLGSTKTDIPGVGSGTYATTGETASGTSTGTFNRYYRVYGPMPSSIISTAIAAYWQWGFSAQGYSTGWQLERVPTSTSKPTPYEHVHPSVTINRCRRYAYRKYNSRHVTGWKRHDSNVNWEARHPVLGTHMPSGSNQSADPYGIILHTAGTFTNFQSVWQNPAITSLGRYGYNPADGSFIVFGTSNYSGSHIVIPSWESFEYEVQHGFF